MQWHLLYFYATDMIAAFFMFKELYEFFDISKKLCFFADIQISTLPPFENIQNLKDSEYSKASAEAFENSGIMQWNVDVFKEQSSLTSKKCLKHFWMLETSGFQTCQRTSVLCA